MDEIFKKTPTMTIEDIQKDSNIVYDHYLGVTPRPETLPHALSFNQANDNGEDRREEDVYDDSAMLKRKENKLLISLRRLIPVFVILYVLIFVLLFRSSPFDITCQIILLSSLIFIICAEFFFLSSEPCG